MMWDSFRRDLRRSVRASSGGVKGLLLANYEAEREIYGTTTLTPSALREGLKGIRSAAEVREFRTTLEGGERLSAS
jgi:hypothetical protein